MFYLQNVRQSIYRYSNAVCSQVSTFLGCNNFFFSFFTSRHQTGRNNLGLQENIFLIPRIYYIGRIEYFLRPIHKYLLYFVRRNFKLLILIPNFQYFFVYFLAKYSISLNLNVFQIANYNILIKLIFTTRDGKYHTQRRTKIEN